MDEIGQRISEIRAQIDEAAKEAGRDPSEVALMAVSKRKPAEAIAEAHQSGQVLFGENRVQELEEKVPALPQGIEWHLIGHLQKNKVRKVLPLVTSIDSIDSLALATRIDRIAGELDLKTRGLLQVNISADPAKSGFTPDDLRAQLGEIAALSNLEVTGLMTIPAWDPDPEQTRPHFAALRELRNELASVGGASLSELSMGMSGDFRAAIAEGSTMVRVGTALFGERA